MDEKDVDNELAELKFIDVHNRILMEIKIDAKHKFVNVTNGYVANDNTSKLATDIDFGEPFK